MVCIVKDLYSEKREVLCSFLVLVGFFSVIKLATQFLKGVGGDEISTGNENGSITNSDLGISTYL